MSAFPGAGARIYTNEAGEVIGWDYPPDDDGPDFDDRDADRPEVEPFICKADHEEVWLDDDDAIVEHYEVCEDPDHFAEHFGDTLRDRGVID